MARGEIKATTLADGVATTPATASPVQGTYLEVTEAAAPGTPSSGYGRLWLGTDGKWYTTDDAGTTVAIGSGAGGLNFLESGVDDATGWTAETGMAVATTSTAAQCPLSPQVDTAIRITPSSGTLSAYVDFTVPAACSQQVNMIQWHQLAESGYATGDLKLVLKSFSDSGRTTSATTYTLSTDVSGVSSIPNATGTYRTTWTGDGRVYYRLYITRVSGTTPLDIVRVTVGPDKAATGGATGATNSHATTVGGLGAGGTTAATTLLYWYRDGENMIMWGNITKDATPGSGASDVTATMPSGVTIDVTRLPNTSSLASQNNRLGPWNIRNASSKYGHVIPSSTTVLRFTRTDSASAELTGADVTAAATIGIGPLVIPITEWRGSGVLSILQDETLTEWQSYTPTWTNVTTGNGTVAAVWKRIGDSMRVRLAFTLGSSSSVSGNIKVSLPTGYTIDSTKIPGYGGSGAIVGTANIFDASPAGWHIGGVIPDSTTVVALTSDDGAANMNATIPITFTTSDVVGLDFVVPILEWRGKSNGACGFGFHQPEVMAGLVPSAGLKGVASNTSAATGYVGEYVSATLARASAVSLTTNVAVNVTSISLTAGDWDLSGAVGFATGASTSITELDAATTTTSATLPGSTNVFQANSTGVYEVDWKMPATVPGAGDLGIQLIPHRVSLSATTTLYLVARGTFTVSTLGAYGGLWARRVR